MNSITLTGNLTRDPELRFTASGKAVTSISVAETPRRRNEQTGQFEDGQTSYYTATLWGSAAQNVAESLTSGHRIILSGRLVERSFTATRGEREGQTIRRHEIIVDEIGPSLRFATAKPEKAARGAEPVETDEPPF